MTGSLDKSFEGIPRTTRVERSTDQVQNNSKFSNLFAGTQEKCVACDKTVYPIEKIDLNGQDANDEEMQDFMEEFQDDDAFGF